MNTRVQTFVGGAIALMGFRALLWIPRGLIVRDSVYIMAGLVIGLGLPLGLAILRGLPSAPRLAEAYLALCVLGPLISVEVSKLGMLPGSAPRLGWWSLSDIIAPAVLLAFLLWGRVPQPNAELDGSDSAPPPR